MEPFNDLVEKLRRELVELAQKEGNLRDEKVVRKSQELDEFLNSFYELVSSGVQDCTARTRETIDEIVAAALCKKGLTDKNRLSRLKRLCCEVGKKLSLSPLQLGNLDLLARVHNLGMVVIPNRLLLKKGPLTEKERQIIRRHPEKGYRIALYLEELSGIADLILKHHEHWDGSGYPLGIKKAEIPVECRILAVVDAYGAMTSDRPYRRAMREEDALAKLKRCAGGQFDPELVEAFYGVMDRGPERWWLLSPGNRK